MANETSRRWADVLIGALMTISLALSSWSLSKVVEHEKAIAVIATTIGKLPAQYPPQDYRDMINERFNRVYEDLRVNRDLLLDVQKKVTVK